jgi:DNA-directed RNA polymerase specialized sigma24 family protein
VPDERCAGKMAFVTEPGSEEHRAAIKALLSTSAHWMRNRSRRAARRYKLEAEDILQVTWLRLLKSRAVADLTNDGLRTWLGQRIEWAASELARQRRHDGGVRIDTDEVDALLAEADAQAPRTEPPETSSVDASFLHRLGLNRHQVQVVLGDCSGLEVSLREFAALAGRSHAAIRKDKQRALARIERWMGLDPEERRVFTAFRVTGSVDAGARRTGHSPDRFRRLLNSANTKVDAAFTEGSTDTDAS